MFYIDELQMFDPIYDGDEIIINNTAEAQMLNSDDALVDCINKYGVVDLSYMSGVSGLPAEQLVVELRGSAIFQIPEEFAESDKWDITKGWVLRSQYLRGNIPLKLKVAKKANKKFPGCFEANISALSELLPDALSIEDIHVSLGASWLPAKIYSQFIKELLSLQSHVSVYYNKELSIWKVDTPDEAKTSVLNTLTYGTSYMSAIKIIEQTMNAKTVKVYDYIWSGGYTYGGYERVFNKSETLAVQEKQKSIIRAFDEWVQADEYRSSLIQEYYNDTFVGYAHSPFDGSFLKLSDLNSEITLYKHQRDAIARIVLSGQSVLLAHDVGTGKTYEMIVGVHELKRMGLSQKNLVVVPNNVLQDIVDAHHLLYPSDQILPVFPADFAPAYRNEVLSHIKDDDYTAIYMAYSSFDMIAMSKDYYINKMSEQLKELRVAAVNARHKREKRALEADAERLSKKLSKYILEAEETPWLNFDKLGVDTLVVDEAHNYKNIPLSSRADNIVGMHGKGSKKCAEMVEKCRNVSRLIFATGTPLTNSLTDLFVLQSYLQPEELKFREIDSFDMWINTFGERETNFEVDVDSNNLRSMTRFSTFHNLTELMSLFSLVCDFHHTQEEEDVLPDFNGYQDICVPKSSTQSEYIKSLSERCEDIREKRVKRNEDNLLKVTTDGRKCALDIRLVGVVDEEETATKIDVCADNILEIYHKYPDTCQLVFSDIGTPKSSFNIYDALRNKLTQMGIPLFEIAFVHDATTEKARTKLFAKINSGVIRVVVGSTAKLGVGVNVQERLIALHHLSVPWRPADMVQREGRIIRRGNTCEEVFIYRYITEGSFDSYSWQLLENKQRFISSFLSGTAASREMDDIADAVLSYAEVKALAIGNPLIKKRVETANMLERTKMAARTRQKQIAALRSVIDTTPKQLQKLRKLKKTIKADSYQYRRDKESISNDERIAFGEELIAALLDNKLMPEERNFDEYQGFTIVLPANMMYEKPYLYICSVNGGRYYLEMDTDKPMGCSKSIDYLLEHLLDRANNVKVQIEQAIKHKEEAERDLEYGNPYHEEITKLEEELAIIDKELNEKEAS